MAEEVESLMNTNGMQISIIVPVYNDPQNLRECLAALRAAHCATAEIIVVDDASSDETPLIAANAGVTVLRLQKNSGPAAARNFGARHAKGAILFFVDADVVIAPGAIERLLSIFTKQHDIAAVFGSYDTQPRATGIISQYRNLLHHFVHQNGDTNASTFWAGCGAVRRSIFLSLGGFDEGRFPRASIEDIEFGYRLRQAGHRIFLDKALQGTHLKKWTLRSVIWTDVVCRAIPWSQLIVTNKYANNDLNLSLGQRLSVALVGFAIVTLVGAIVQRELLMLSLAALIGVGILNRTLYYFFFRQHGLLFACSCIPLHLLYYLCSGASYSYIRVDTQLRGKREYTIPRPLRLESPTQSGQK